MAKKEAPNTDARLTPMMKQYEQMKAQYPDALLLFRMGDFYESFNEDAVRVSAILGITLTKRSNGGAADTNLAGFPYHALDTYLPKLVRAGQRVAICDQLEDPKLAKGLVKRGVTEVVTPGVTLNEGVLEHRENNFLAVFSPHAAAPGIAFIDVSTGEFYLAQGDAEYIDKLLTNFAPKELLVPHSYWDEAQSLYAQKFYLSRIDDWAFSFIDATARLQQHFGTTTLKGYGIENLYQGLGAAGAALAYLNLTKHAALAHITSISRIEEDAYVWLDRFTLRNLEIFHAAGEGGTPLLHVVDRTSSPMGARLLKRWLALPLKDTQRILLRQQAVAALHQHSDLRTTLERLLTAMGDLERLISRAATGRIMPRETVRLGQSLALLLEIKQSIDAEKLKPLNDLSDRINPCSNLAERIEREINQDPTPLGRGGVFASNVNDELNELRNIRTSSENYLEELRAREAERTGIQNLKVGFNSVFGYYFEVRNTRREQVPEDWTRKQTLVQAERYISQELKLFEEKILGAENRILEIEAKLYQDLLLQIQEYITAIQHDASIVAQLDVLVALATLAYEKGWTPPTINDEYSLRIHNGWHPVIAHQLPPGQEYVPNSLTLDPQEQQIMMITGPNMSGKSALLRQTAIIVLLAQIGSFVPAAEAQIGIVDKIFTRVGASDNISAGESTFMVEMTEAASILNNLSSRSLILLDEIGRGTSTYDGISIAWAMAEYIHDAPKGKAKTLFATHYHELNEMENLFPRIKNYNVSVKEIDGKIIFLRRLQPGGIEHSFGIHVAKLAGMPPRVVQRANQILATLEAKRNIDRSQVRDAIQAADAPPVQVFEAEDPVLKAVRMRISEMDINRMTPLEALNELNQIRHLIGLE